MSRVMAILVGLVLLVSNVSVLSGGQTPTHVDVLLLHRYVGQYQLSPTYLLTVFVDGDRLYVRAPGREARLLVPASETEFVEVGSGLRITFGIREDTRAVDHLIFEQEGYGRRAEKVGSEVGVDPATRPALQLSERVLMRYVGIYEEQPGFGITIIRRGTQLTARMTEQAEVEIFAETETDFFYRDKDAGISFLLNGNVVNALVLRQGGDDLKMQRVD